MSIILAILQGKFTFCLFFSYSFLMSSFFSPHTISMFLFWIGMEAERQSFIQSSGIARGGQSLMFCREPLHSMQETSSRPEPFQAMRSKIEAYAQNGSAKLNALYPLQVCHWPKATQRAQSRTQHWNLEEFNYPSSELYAWRNLLWREKQPVVLKFTFFVYWRLWHRVTHS